ncbi:MAG: rhomboid family intramembrane serine protease [Acidobacteriota bacterium]
MSLRQVEENEIEAAHEGNAVQMLRSPLPLYTIILIAMIGAVFVTQFLTSSDPYFFSVDRYSAITAGFDKPAFIAGEYWRILTGAAIHSGILHVLMNCYAFYSFGKLFEMLTNRAHLAIVFLLSAIGGGILSLVFKPDVTSVGASGGIVGLISYLAVYAFRRRQFISAEFRRSLLINIGFILIFGLVLFRLIDNFGHIGGLITGAIYGLIQIPSDEHVDPRSAGAVTNIAGVVSVVIYGLSCLLAILLLINGDKLA